MARHWTIEERQRVIGFHARLLVVDGSLILSPVADGRFQGDRLDTYNWPKVVSRTGYRERLVLGHFGRLC